MSWEIIQGDCLEVMAGIPAATVDAIVTDPPYIIGGISVGNSRAKNGGWADMENAGRFYGACLSEYKRLLRPEGYAAVFGNWRSLPSYIRAAHLAHMPAVSCLVWDKLWIGPASPNQLRPRWELVLFYAREFASIRDRSFADVVSEKWLAGNCRETAHPAEKPVPLLRRLCRLITRPGGLILDPFAGSGSTGKAALLEGFRFLGIEREADYCEIARARIAAASAERAERNTP